MQPQNASHDLSMLSVVQDPLIDEVEGLLKHFNFAKATNNDSDNTSLKLFRAEAKYQALVEQIPAITFVAPLDQSTEKMFVSPQIESILGFSVDEWLADPFLWYRQLHSEDRVKWLKDFSHVIETNEPFNSTYRVHNIYGKIVWIRVNAHLVRDENGKPLCVQGVSFDITELKEKEEEAKKTSDNYRRLLDGAADIISVTTEDGTILYVNPAFETTTGFSARDWIGKQFKNLVHPDDFDNIMVNYTRLIQEGVSYEMDVRIRTVSGEYRYVSATCRPTFDENRITGVFTICRDVTERTLFMTELQKAHDELEKRVEQRTAELVKMNERVLRSNSELQQFAYIASHDLQEPLRTISVHMQLIDRMCGKQLTDEARYSIKSAVEAANRMRILMEDLLTYSRVGNEEEKLVKVDLLEVLNIVLKNSAATISATQAKITYSQMPCLYANKWQMVQVFQNIVGNALKFHGTRNPEIHIEAVRAGDEWRFSISDNGIGIDQRYLTKIFSVFQRLHTREEYSGTGIGLAICKKIVERAGGKIWAESVVNQGSTFYFTLPAEELVDDRLFN